MMSDSLGFPLRLNMHTSRQPCVRKCLRRPEECSRHSLKFWVEESTAHTPQLRIKCLISTPIVIWTMHMEANVIFYSTVMTTICNTRGHLMSSTLWHAVEGVSTFPQIVIKYFQVQTLKTLTTLNISRSRHWKPWQHQHKWCSWWL